MAASYIHGQRLWALTLYSGATCQGYVGHGPWVCNFLASCLCLRHFFIVTLGNETDPSGPTSSQSIASKTCLGHSLRRYLATEAVVYALPPNPSMSLVALEGSDKAQEGQGYPDGTRSRR